jgi:hypothetical protein
MELKLDERGTHTLFGNHDENLRMLEDAWSVKISSRGNEIFVQGAAENVSPVEKLLTEIQVLIEKGYPIKKSDVFTASRVLRDKPETDLVEFFTDDVVFIDPAWGRVEGIEGVREFLVDSMTGIEDWTFPVDRLYVDGDEVVVKFRQVLPGGRSQSGYSTLLYAGGGKFRYEEDVLNMAHVLEDLRAIGFQPPEGMQPPPRQPVRDFRRPA